MIIELKRSLNICFYKALLNCSIDNHNEEILWLISSDLQRFTGSNQFDKNSLNALDNPSFRFLFFFRLCQKKPISFIKKKVHSISYYFHRKYFVKYGLQIPLNTSIGCAFHILHFGNIVVNPLSVIGDNCTVSQGVLIGQNKKGTPIIGNKVWIGANSSIVGNIKIGNNVLIAPNSYVNKDIPSNSLVIGNPCLIYQKTPNIIDGYIVNTTEFK
jgi:serine O-acetyltransferase